MKIGMSKCLAKIYVKGVFMMIDVQKYQLVKTQIL
jgi:hypothetical protein